ncbi:MCE family protein [Sciscionella marina]|uniref:MCE family protein n=1 Tax=Sciscionella marina TaxID=508770 RepID=UPI000363B4A0|nr:MCE family protein [Sciscionella marina]
MAIMKDYGARITGAGMLVAFVGIISLTLALMNNAFASTVSVRLMTDRAGLMMAPSNSVKMHGVVIGTVKGVQLTDQGAALDLAIQSQDSHLVPQNASASISPETAFGNKFISLSAPATNAGRPVRDGTVLTADHVGVEVNKVFQNLTDVLSTAKPSQVNTLLNSMSTALQGKGGQLGNVLAQVDRYLADINPEISSATNDLNRLGDVAGLYASLARPLFNLLDKGTNIGNTLVDKRPSVDGFLRQLGATGQDGGNLLASNGKNLVDSLNLLLPTSRLLDKYAPEYPCLFQGMDKSQKRLTQIMGSRKYGPGARVMVGFLPGKEPYRYPQNLPRQDTHSGPACLGLPMAGVNGPAPKYKIPGAGMEVPGAGMEDPDSSEGIPGSGGPK